MRRKWRVQARNTEDRIIKVYHDYRTHWMARTICNGLNRDYKGPSFHFEVAPIPEKNTWAS